MQSSWVKVLYFVSFLHFATALRCYICNSRSNPMCHDPVNIYQLELTECSPEVIKRSSSELSHAFNGIRELEGRTAYDIVAGAKLEDIDHMGAFERMQCQKITIRSARTDDITVVRGCQFKSRMNSMDYTPCTILHENLRNDIDATLTYCDVCHHNGCNNAPGYLPTIITLVLPLLILATMLR